MRGETGETGEKREQTGKSRVKVLQFLFKAVCVERVLKRHHPRRKSPFAQVGARTVQDIASVRASPFWPNLSRAAQRLLKTEKSDASASNA